VAHAIHVDLVIIAGRNVLGLARLVRIRVVGAIGFVLEALRIAARA